MGDITITTEALMLGLPAAVGVPVAIDFLKRLLGPVGDEGGKAIAHPLREWNERRAKRCFDRVQGGAKLLHDAGKTATAVPGRILLPWVEAASVEDDPDLQTMWETLLANAADPERANDILPAFVSIMRELSPVEAIVLRALYLESLGEARIDYTADGVGARFNPRMLRIESEGSVQDLTLPFGNFRVVADNLARLGVVEQVYTGTRHWEDRSSREYSALTLSPLGHHFVQTCTQAPARSA
jgi:hypothetical protein